jgi:hypothetical protein
MLKKLLFRLVPIVTGTVALCCTAWCQDLTYNGPGSSGATFQNQISVAQVIDDTYFGMIGHYFGYGGIQQNGSSSARVGIFSIWDFNGEESTVYAYNPNLSVKTVGRFGGEGTGVQFLFNYSWVTNRAYRCAYRNYLESDGLHMRFGAFFYDSSIGSWVYCVTHRALTNGGYPNYLYSFNENYGGTYGNRQATMSNAWWCDTTGVWTDQTSGSISNIPSGPNDYGQILTPSTGFEFNSNTNPATLTQTNGAAVSYSRLGSEAPIYIPYLLSCGNASTSGGNSNGTSTWEPDAYWTPGDWNYTYNDPTTVSTSGVTNPAPQTVYQNLRGGDNFTYNFFGLKPSTNYTVRLHFCENYDTAGQRLQNVFINGSQVLTNFDVYATAGGKYKAVVKQFTAKTSSAGIIIVNFQRASGSDWANICGIDVH